MTDMDLAKEEARKIVVKRAFDSDTGQRNKERIIAALRAAELRGRVKGMFDAAQIARGSHTAVGYDIFAAIHTAATKLESPPTT